MKYSQGIFHFNFVKLVFHRRIREFMIFRFFRAQLFFGNICMAIKKSFEKILYLKVPASADRNAFSADDLSLSKAFEVLVPSLHSRMSVPIMT